MGRDKKGDALDELNREFSLWRKQREKRGPTPPGLLAGVDALRKEIPLGHIAKTLHINPTDIKRRLRSAPKPIRTFRSQTKGAKKGSPLSFVKMDSSWLQSPSQPKEAGVIECENPRGYKLRIYTSPGPVDQIPGWLKETFWREG